MKISTLMAAGVGYLAGNEKARRMAMDGISKLRTTPPAKAVEDKVSGQVSELSYKMGRTRTDLIDLSEESSDNSSAGMSVPAGGSGAF